MCTLTLKFSPGSGPDLASVRVSLLLRTSENAIHVKNLFFCESKYTYSIKAKPNYTYTC